MPTTSGRANERGRTCTSRTVISPPPVRDGERIAQRVLVGGRPRAGERVDGVPHLVALADPDQVAEVVGDDAEVVAVILDVGREKRAVAPAEDDLLAAVGCLPIHFHVQLVGLHQPGRLGESLADLGQEEDEPVGPGSIAAQRRIGFDGGSLIHRPADQRQCFGRIPALCRQRRSAGGEQQQSDGPAGAPHTAHRVPLTIKGSMAGIFRGLWGRASWLCLAAAACGGARSSSGAGSGAPAPPASVPLAEAIVLETSGPPPPDTTVTFTRRRAACHRPAARSPGLRRVRRAELRAAGVRRAGTRGAGAGAPAAWRIRARRQHQPADPRQCHGGLPLSPLFRGARASARGLRLRRSLRARARVGRMRGRTACSHCCHRPVPPRTCSRSPLPSAGTYLVAAPPQ